MVSPSTGISGTDAVKETEQPLNRERDDNGPDIIVVKNVYIYPKIIDINKQKS